MAESLFFRIPEPDKDCHAALIESVPPEWGVNGRIDGYLKAPDRLIEQGYASPEYGFLFHPFSPSNPRVIGPLKSGDGVERLLPNMFDLTVDWKRPGFLIFSDVGLSPSITFEGARAIIAAYLKLGYLGRIFLSMNPTDDQWRCSASCEMVLYSWVGNRTNESGPQPARIRLEWDERLGGQQMNIDPIMMTCFKFGLVSYEPAAIRG